MIHVYLRLHLDLYVYIMLVESDTGVHSLCYVYVVWSLGLSHILLKLHMN